MFKKLKQRINEEQSPQRSAQSPQQAQVRLLAKLTSVYTAELRAKDDSCEVMARVE